MYPSIIFIKQLVGMELIKKKIIEGYIYSYPVLELTEAGKKILDEKIKIELQVVKEQRPITVGESEIKTFELFSEGKNAQDIAKERNLAVSTIYTHSYHLIANGYLSSSDVVDEGKIKSIIEVCKQFKNEPRLKELKEKLPENISYGEIRCVVAGINKNKNA